jgi:ABC-type antimicrobial peptide transport system permease subunit
MALGAERTSVIWLVLKRALTFTAIGAAIGLAGAIALTRLIGGLLYGTTPYDAVAFAGASAGLALLVMVASLIPAWRATRVDPIVALRTE